MYARLQETCFCKLATAAVCACNQPYLPLGLYLDTVEPSEPCPGGQRLLQSKYLVFETSKFSYYSKQSGAGFVKPLIDRSKMTGLSEDTHETDVGGYSVNFLITTAS